MAGLRIAFLPNPYKASWDSEVQSVIDILRTKPRQTLDEIAEKASLSRYRVAEVLKQLAKNESLGRNKGRFYLLEGSYER